MDNLLQWPLGKLDFSDGCIVMGILNVTPDSFSDGGDFFDTDAAIARGIEMANQGAAIIDVGPESSRPGSDRVPPDQQIARAVPVIERLSKEVDIPISIDTYNVEVAAAALDAGASIVNDITGLADENMIKLIADRGAVTVIMHMLGTPETMQTDPQYEDVTKEVLAFLIERAQRAQTFGIPSERIIIDPGIGFGKTTEHNLQLLRDTDKFVASGYRVLIGTSRKRFIGEITGKQIPSERIHGTAATVALCAAAGASIVRVHDIAAMMDVVKMTTQIS